MIRKTSADILRRDYLTTFPWDEANVEVHDPDGAHWLAEGIDGNIRYLASDARSFTSGSTILVGRGCCVR
ncbi:unnamed protein product [Clonostachys byssicola]|uniref:Uncharacterized protein n=1 Tax=Clonostachys byssicola TaxID=160290 RepID=A0A9N9Y029_9HYPO|nr:unnamed protein product [Clonostachys byssicola]